MIPIYVADHEAPIDYICEHENTVLVESVADEIVAHLCRDCDLQLPPEWRP